MSQKQKSGSDWRDRDPAFSREQSSYRQPVPSRELVLDDLDALGQPMTRAELEKHYELRDEAQREAFEHRLRAMLRDGQLVENRKGALGSIRRMDLVRGRVQGHRDGFGFLIPDEGGEDVFLNPRQMRLLMHGDRATARIVGRDRRGKPEGRVVDVLERANTRVVGRFNLEHGVGHVVPDNARIQHDILIPEDARGGARTGQIVSAELVEPPGKRGQAIGRVVEVLGEHLDPGMEIDIAVRSHGIPFEWPEGVVDEAESIGDVVPRQHYKGREDLRDLPLVTIDGADAKDFDDAVHCRPTRSGWQLTVAIADVSAYVKPGSGLDTEAVNRGTSVYFPGHVVPMLPEALSNGLCSLNPDVDRLCLVCEMRVSRKGEVSRPKFYSAVMRSHARFTYERVADLLADPASADDDPDGDLLPELQALYDVYEALLQARQQRGAIDFETTETQIIFNKDRKIGRIEPVSRTDAHRLIEECMIAANVAAARFLGKHRMPLLYRVHSGPDADRLTDLREFLAERGLGLGGGDQPEAEHFARLLKQAGERDDARLIQTVLLRSLTRAVYSPDNNGHFGLALAEYAHFTSPIRRYPDLLVHRAIKHVEAGGKPATFDYTHGDMVTLGAGCSAAEQRADDATRDVDDWLKCEYLRDHVGDEWNGMITGVTAFGLFVELDHIYASGLIHVSSLSNDYYHYDATARCLRGERSGTVHRLADRVRVKVVRVDLDERKIDFEPASSVAEPKPKARKGRRRTKRR
ncbi:MAG: ribonuclease R [Salinisphaeraceae bacterium]